MQNHLLIEPVAALLEREDTGYRDLRKALVRVLRNKEVALWLTSPSSQRTPILDSIARLSSLQQRTIITTYYQETLEDREIDLKEYFESARRGGRPFVVFILRCSPEENTRRLLGRSRSPKSRLTDASILKEIRQHHYVYSFFDDGFKKPDVWEYQLDIDDTEPEKAARKILELMKDIPGTQHG